MPSPQNFVNHVRIPENNDWVIFILLGCIFLYLFMMNIVEREASLRDFLLQKYFDSSNNLPSWIITSSITTLTLATLISQTIPTVPQFISEIQISGFQLNKFGYTLLVIAFFYLSKSALGFMFYHSTGDGKKWAVFYFTATKFYFILSFILIVLCIVHYYFPVDRHELFFYYLIFSLFVFIFKIFFYLFHRNNILPQKWYYKFLYICTLQITPLLLLWKLLFF
ncbi:MULTISPECIES: DUF4271 domain-containing protein [Chryseobacterium]|uniref:DUF4271 domain-containing protein n=1 Tax=Chryseobacterium camelliae TaxID=1265445 RepID=A0ABU0TN36_9FLAO|nr:hypothetical protein [Chryseobacterium camelliae]MDQ1102377.1 hypothetical protein [Chryseobacterium sp. SORGH_AS_1048]MDR6085814.1 hypothetical protein [Chryseobacterium sp. SORGH_AS_0909]MDR6130177.1 hypothetical protein [Chryseobacterium sp. SORGH_AS_1175]MDT3407694.1 hypothetical protein [Pseudacidovorax intermedius]